MKIREEIEIADNDHIWLRGKQYISLSRFNELKKTEVEEIDLLNQKVDELTEENEAYRKILKKELKEEGNNNE